MVYCLSTVDRASPCHKDLLDPVYHLSNFPFVFARLVFKVTIVGKIENKSKVVFRG